MNYKIGLICFALLPFKLIFGWGESAHKEINKKMFQYLPYEMGEFLDWKDYLINHASDADNRKDIDPNEGPKHSINLDKFVDFFIYGHITQDLDSLIQKYSSPYVYDQGILPWAILDSYDSLKNCLVNREWKKAKQVLTDLAHYVGDSRMPFHLRKDYDIFEELHQRFENDMMDKYADDIDFTKDTAIYINDLKNTIFNSLYKHYPYTDSIIAADEYAQFYANSTSSNAYFALLFNKSKSFTDYLFSNASHLLSSLLYTAWTDAGKPAFNTTSVESNIANYNFCLYQNYPNPFNPSTTIEYEIPTALIKGDALVNLDIYDVLGNHVTTLVNQKQSAGNYKVQFDGANFPSGIYFYRLSVNAFSITKKLILIK